MAVEAVEGQAPPSATVRARPVRHALFRLVGVDGTLVLLVFLFAWAFTRALGVPFDPLFGRTFIVFENILTAKLLVVGSAAFLIHMARIGRFHPPGHQFDWGDIRAHVGRSFLVPGNICSLLRCLVMLLLITAAVTNVKPLIPLVNERNYDGLLLRLDLLLCGGADPYAWLAARRTPFLTRWFNAAYVSLFFFFCLTLVILFVQKRREMRVLVLSMLLAKLVGNAVHFAMPSLGDVYVEERTRLYENMPGKPVVCTIQQSLWQDRVKLLRNPEKYTPSNPFTGIAAFPSLHCALFAVMILLAWRCHRWLLPLYVPAGVLMAISTLYFGWHYISDCVAGVLLGAGAVYASYRLLDWETALEQRWFGTGGPQA